MRMVLLVISAIVMGCSAFALGREYPAAIFARLDTGDMIARLSESPTIGPVALPLTWTGQKEVLVACIQVQASLLMALQSSDIKNNVLQICDDFADRATARTPTFAMGYLVKAQTADGLQDLAASNAALVKGQAFAPFEGWQALRRVDLGLRHPDRLDAAARRALEQDLSFLMATGFGSVSIAKLYVANPDHRALIEAQIGSLPTEAQNRFLSELKQAATLGQPAAGNP